MSHYSSDTYKISVRPSTLWSENYETFHCENQWFPIYFSYKQTDKYIDLFPRNIKNPSRSALFVDEDYQLWNYSNESSQIGLLLARIPSYFRDCDIKRTNLMETSGSDRRRSKIKPPIKIFVKRKGGDRYCRRGVLQKYWKKKQYRDSCLIFYTSGENWICHAIIHCLLCKQSIRSKRQIRFREKFVKFSPLIDFSLRIMCIVSSQRACIELSRMNEWPHF